MNDESAGPEDQEEEEEDQEEYDSEDDETYDGEEDEEDLSDDRFVNESSDEGVGGIENDYDSDGNVIDDDDDDDYDEDDDDAMGNVGGGGFHPLLHAHPMFQQALLHSLAQEEENTGGVPHPHAVAQIIQDMQQHFLQHHQHQHHDIGEEGEFEDQYDMMMFDGGGGGA